MSFEFPPVKILVMVFLLCLVLFLRYVGAIRFKGSAGIAKYNNGGSLQLKGTVSSWPQIKESKQIIILSDLAILEKSAERKVFGKIQVNSRLYPRYFYGEVLVLQGQLKEPPVFDDFNYREFLSVDGIYSLMSYPKITILADRPPGLYGLVKILYDFRYLLESTINQNLPEPHASLLAGILIGAKRDFSVDFLEKLRSAGVLHIIVASGYNVSVVLGLVGYLSLVIGRKLSLLIALPLALMYAIITGLQPPIIRAVIMASGATLAEIFGRQKYGLLWLFFSAYLMLIWNPLWIKSLSFQLSFLATFGMLTLQPILQTLISRWPIFKKSWLENPVGEALVTTVAVQTLTLPLIFYNLQRISLIGFLVNPLVLWTIPLSMFGGMLMIFLGLFSGQWAYLAGLFVWLPMEFFVKVVEILG